MLRDALGYPWDDGEAGTTLVLGGLLTLLGVLVLPALVVLGYGLRVVGAAMDEAEPPGFGSPVALLVDGARAAVVLLAYVVVPFAVGAVVIAAGLGLFGVRAGRVVTSPADAAAAGGLLLVAAVLVVALGLALLYVGPAAVVHLVRTGSLRSAFALDDVRALLATDAYAAGWLVSLAVLAGAALVIAVLNAVSVGVVLSGFVGFYAFVAIGAVYGWAAAGAGFAVEEAADADEVPNEDADEAPTEDADENE